MGKEKKKGKKFSNPSVDLKSVQLSYFNSNIHEHILTTSQCLKSE